MPRLPIDYANTVIYKIVCNDLSITELYVGHTTDFIRRKWSHRNNCIYENGRREEVIISYVSVEKKLYMTTSPGISEQSPICNL